MVSFIIYDTEAVPLYSRKMGGETYCFTRMIDKIVIVFRQGDEFSDDFQHALVEMLRDI